jgi:pimeloyl-ACP methyl ester carboxylesterase
MSRIKGKVLRTPDARFADLPGYDFAPHYVDDLPGYEGLRMHYLDEGPQDADRVFLCLHGQPTWSYLYRKMIPHFTASGARAVAPDFYGFGKSDTPAEESVYTFDFHRGSIVALIERLDLTGITLVCQDWGGLIGLTLPMDMPDRFDRLLVMNTALGTGDVPLGQGFIEWRGFSNSQPDLDIAGLMQRASQVVGKKEAAAYAAPYPDAAYKAGVRRFPNLVPDSPDAEGAELSRRAREWWQNEWDGPTFMAVGMRDPVLGPAAMAALREIIRGCPEPMEIKEGGHFVQEWGDEIAPAALQAFGDI